MKKSVLTQFAAKSMLILAGLVLSAASIAAAAPIATSAPTFVAGKDYRVVTTAEKATRSKDGKVEVVEFFSYGCPGCNAFEPYLERWENTNKHRAHLKRVPALFHSQWLPLAKAYYIADGLGIERKMSPLLFNAIHVKHQDLTNVQTLAAIFAANGIKNEQFNNAYQFSPVIEAQVMQGSDMMLTYKIQLIPSVVVAGTYQTDMEMAKDDPKRLASIVDYLTTKAQKK
jgi:thiol:disulfide interchange protein DsbA